MERQEPRVVEIGGDDDTAFGPGFIEDLGVGSGAEAEVGGVDGVVALGLEMCRCLRCHRHIDGEFQPWISIVSSSARLAA